MKRQPLLFNLLDAGVVEIIKNNLSITAHLFVNNYWFPWNWITPNDYVFQGRAEEKETRENEFYSRSSLPNQTAVEVSDWYSRQRRQGLCKFGHVSAKTIESTLYMVYCYTLHTLWPMAMSAHGEEASVEFFCGGL